MRAAIKKRENQCQSAACEQKKPLPRNENLIQTKKLGLEWAVNGLGKPSRKKSAPKIEKTVKIWVKLPRVNTKPLPRNRIFVQTPFSHYFKIRAKKIQAAKPLAFSLHFLLRRDQNHYSNLTWKIMKMCEQILKKRQRPNTIQILWIVKNQEKANNSPSYRCAAINNKSKTHTNFLKIKNRRHAIFPQTSFESN